MDICARKYEKLFSKNSVQYLASRRNVNKEPSKSFDIIRVAQIYSNQYIWDICMEGISGINNDRLKYEILDSNLKSYMRLKRNV